MVGFLKNMARAMSREARGTRHEVPASRFSDGDCFMASPFAMTTKANAMPKRLRFGMTEPTSHAPANDNFPLSSLVCSRAAAFSRLISPLTTNH